MILIKLGDLWWKFYGFGRLLSISQIGKLCWARHFELTDGKECMGKTIDRYSEGASKHCKQRLQDRLRGNFSKFQAFCNK